jgi:hypothetical protein
MQSYLLAIALVLHAPSYQSWLQLTKNFLQILVMLLIPHSLEELLGSPFNTSQASPRLGI